MVVLERQVELARLIAEPFAHRGLHGSSRPENSRAAFEAAISVGHGIELDVQANLDRQAYVFHDRRLDRLTDAVGPIARFSASELRSVRLRGCSETVPTLREALDVVDARVPLLIELKTSRATVDALCVDVLGALDKYRGKVGIMSYHPRVGQWFGQFAAQFMRGLVVRETGMVVLRKPMFRRRALRRASPDFLAYRIEDLPSRFASVQRARGLPILAWTCRTDEDRARAAQYADQVIYEEPPR